MSNKKSIRKPRNRPKGITPVHRDSGKICYRCGTVRNTDDFDVGEKYCKQCTTEKNTPRDRAKEKAEAMAEELFSTKASNLDGFMEAVFMHLGGENEFAVMVADQIQHAFTHYPGRASNLTAALNFMKLMGVRDSNQTQREMKDLSVEELKLTKLSLAKEVFMQTLGEDERVAFAKQLLESTGMMLTDEHPELIEAGEVPEGDYHDAEYS